MKTESRLLTLAAVVVAALSLSAEFADGRLEIPTYTPGGYEKTPVFYTPIRCRMCCTTRSTPRPTAT